MSVLDELIEEAGLIWLHERDGVPCSLRRARVVEMCRELVREMPAAGAGLPQWPRWSPCDDWQLRAANDDTFEPLPEMTDNNNDGI